MPRKSDSFAGHSVAVVGGGQGLGRQYCIDLGKAGAKVLVTGRSRNVQNVVDEIRASGGQAEALVCDAADAEAIVERACSAFGRIDSLIINAGITRDQSFAKMTRDAWDAVLNIHLDAAFACAHAAWLPMRNQGSGSIVFTTSGAGLHGNFGQANYATAKAGIIGLTLTLAAEGVRSNIRVNAIAPMATTAMTEGVFNDRLKSNLLVEHVSPYALALIHPQCTATGQVLEVGGGWAAAMRWERSAGMRLENPDISTILDRWDEIGDFTRGLDHPKSIGDCLEAALGTPRQLRTLLEETAERG